MPRYEYKVVPAPSKGMKGQGIKTPEARFSHALQELMNGLAGYGWEYQRAETLPSTERSGLASSTTQWRNVLVFRRPRQDDADAFTPELLPAPDATPPAVITPVEEPRIAPVPKEAPPPHTEQASEEAAKPEPEAETPPAPRDAENERPFWDNGVEPTDDGSGIGSSVEKLAAARKSSKPKD